LSSSSITKEENVKNDNELLGSLSSFAIEEKQARTMMNRDFDSSSFFAIEG
jgi:hypothetical protein